MWVSDSHRGWTWWKDSESDNIVEQWSTEYLSLNHKSCIFGLGTQTIHYISAVLTSQHLQHHIITVLILACIRFFFHRGPSKCPKLSQLCRNMLQTWKNHETWSDWVLDLNLKWLSSFYCWHHFQAPQRLLQIQSLVVRTYVGCSQIFTLMSATLVLWMWITNCRVSNGSWWDTHQSHL